MLNGHALLKHGIRLYVLVQGAALFNQAVSYPAAVNEARRGREENAERRWMAGTCREGNGWPVHVGRGMDGRFMWGGEWMAGTCREGNGWPVHVGRGMDGRYM